MVICTGPSITTQSVLLGNFEEFHDEESLQKPEFPPARDIHESSALEKQNSERATRNNKGAISFIA